MFGDDGTYCYREETVMVLPSSSNRNNELNDLLATDKVLLFPNPATNQVAVRFVEPPLEAPNQLLIYNYMGKKMWQKNLTENNDNTIINIDLAQFTNGIYHLMIKYPKRPAMVKKLIVSKLY